MRTRITTVGFSLIVATLCLGGVAPRAHAVDGVVLIDQARALAGGITPCHNPGFPVVLCEPGRSYRLAGSLTVPDENTIAILITADNVTLDLNGFTIQGPTVCSGSPLTCTPTGSGSGVFTGNNLNITVVNGSVRGMGNHGVFSSGRGSHVEKVHATSNGNFGIVATGTVTGNTATRNGRGGISATGTVTGNTVSDNGGIGGIAAEGTVTGNTVSDNGGTGILSATGTVTGNTVFNNTGFGLSLGFQAGYALNVMSGNTGGTVSFGVSLGHNLCNGALC